MTSAAEGWWLNNRHVVKVRLLLMIGQSDSCHFLSKGQCIRSQLLVMIADMHTHLYACLHTKCFRPYSLPVTQSLAEWCI